MENEEDRKQKKTEKMPSHARWVIRVSLIAVALSAAMSLDDVVISFFVTSAETTTLPLKVYTGLRSGGTPEINALCTLTMGVTFCIVIVSQILGSNKFKRNRREEL